MFGSEHDPSVRLGCLEGGGFFGGDDGRLRVDDVGFLGERFLAMVTFTSEENLWEKQAESGESDDGTERWGSHASRQSKTWQRIFRQMDC